MRQFGCTSTRSWMRYVWVCIILYILIPLHALRSVLSAGGNHTCAVLDNRSVKCWGESTAGQLGLGDTITRGDHDAAANDMGDKLPTVNLGTGRSAIAVNTGWHFSCAVLDNDTVKCWGANGYGQLGQGDTGYRGDNANEMGDKLPAINLGSQRTVSSLAAGAYHICAVLDNGAVKCWGYSSYGQLGLGHKDNKGDNWFEMGDNLPVVDLGTGQSAVYVSTGAFHSCALLRGGCVKCWGQNDHGQLGLGDRKHRGDNPNEMGDVLPCVDLGSGHTAVQISAHGGNHTCALLSDSTVKCWGSNSFGQLSQSHSDS